MAQQEEDAEYISGLFERRFSDSESDDELKDFLDSHNIPHIKEQIADYAGVSPSFPHQNINSLSTQNRQEVIKQVNNIINSNVAKYNVDVRKNRTSSMYPASTPTQVQAIRDTDKQIREVYKNYNIKQPRTQLQRETILNIFNQKTGHNIPLGVFTNRPTRPTRDRFQMTFR